ncbi:MAG: DUF512 domain-containing protein [Chloroflexi bacterium]|nr:DUF512 domain-containing protein [Chloroflexota bacterium]
MVVLSEAPTSAASRYLLGARRPQGGRVASVRSASPAALAGVREGDYVYAINGHRLHDIIDYRFYSIDPDPVLTLDRSGQHENVVLADAADGDLGVEFCDALFTSIRRCANDCDFCFVDMNPSGLRSSLYIRDDDYRLSFLFGDFITLTNLNEHDWQRIGEQRLSPLYVSVHATDTYVRRKLLANPRARSILEDLDRLAALRIQAHCQIVLCPGVNDGDVLERTVTDLLERYPQVLTLAIVPVGLTRFDVKYRAAGMRRLTPAEARDVLRRAEPWQRHYTRIAGEPVLFFSDEMYLLAEVPVPSARSYNGYPQYENGIGMVRSWLDDHKRWRRRTLALRGRKQCVVTSARRITVVTGELFGPFLIETAESLSEILQVPIRAIPIVNDSLGDSVTVAGLLSGRDIVSQLRGREIGDLLIVPRRALDQHEARFLDGMSVEELAATVGAPVKSGRDFGDLVRVLQRGI